MAGMFKSRTAWKLTLSMAVTVVMLATLATDFDDLVFPGWDTPFKRIDAPPAQQYGAKAAVLAVACASFLFVALIPSGDGRRSRLIELLVRALSAVSALTAGWFWLLGETGGRPGPYLIAFVPMTVMLTISMGFGVYLSYVSKVDREREHSKIDWGLVIVGIGILLLCAAVIWVMVWLPKWLF